MKRVYRRMGLSSLRKNSEVGPLAPAGGCWGCGAMLWPGAGEQSRPDRCCAAASCAAANLQNENKTTVRTCFLLQYGPVTNSNTSIFKGTLRTCWVVSIPGFLVCKHKVMYSVRRLSALTDISRVFVHTLEVSARIIIYNGYSNFLPHPS